MHPPTARTFVGFGFGAIQAGLFILEAFRSGRFARAVVAEVVPDVVRAVRKAGGSFHVNVAHADRIEAVQLHPVDLEDPAAESDRERIVEAVAAASEIATAVPSVRFYSGDAAGSIHRLLALGLTRRFSGAAASAGRASPVVVYTAENHNHAAEILRDAVLSEVPAAARDPVAGGTQFLNTVIGKMSGVVPDAAARGLAPVTPGGKRAFLVESFNRILISRIRFPSTSGFQRGIEVFEEKDDLLPFEEAKLYGHNAAHALAGYLAAHLRLERMEELRSAEGLVEFVRAAFLSESGGALLAKYKGVAPLFRPEAFRAYVDDLIERMLNPYLGDLVERVARDPERKLGWEDRLVGTLRLALGQGVAPRRFALGTAAALAFLAPSTLEDPAGSAAVLEPLWRPASPDPRQQGEIVRWIERGLEDLALWKREGRLP